MEGFLADLTRQLEALYAPVPATRCAGSGECCELTPEEFAGSYATMFPLYRAEYHNIVEYVESRFPEARRRKLFACTEERPRRCPFLDADQRCTIYPVRPLICRTYAVMNSHSIAREAESRRGRVPDDWIEGFVRRESGMVCPRVTVLEPEKIEKHTQNLINFAYERELVRLSREVELATGERRRIFEEVARKRSWPLRWTWGGFNAVRFAPLEWQRTQFRNYWKKARLVDGG